MIIHKKRATASIVQLALGDGRQHKCILHDCFMFNADASYLFYSAGQTSEMKHRGGTLKPQAKVLTEVLRLYRAWTVEQSD